MSEEIHGSVSCTLRFYRWRHLRVIKSLSVSQTLITLTSCSCQESHSLSSQTSVTQTPPTHTKLISLLCLFSSSLFAKSWFESSGKPRGGLTAAPAFLHSFFLIMRYNCYGSSISESFYSRTEMNAGSVWYTAADRQYRALGRTVKPFQPAKQLDRRKFQLFVQGELCLSPGIGLAPVHPRP